MKKTTFLAAAVIILLIVNTVTLGSLYLRFSDARPEERVTPRAIIIERLHLDKEQQQKYDRLIAWHRGEIDMLDYKIRQNKRRLYSLLAQGSDEGKSQELIDSINFYQKQAEQTHLKHFRDIRGLCRADQLEYYNELVKDLPRLFGPPPHGKNRP